MFTQDKTSKSRILGGKLDIGLYTPSSLPPMNNMISDNGNVVDKIKPNRKTYTVIVR
jgi:hypothetical protein